MLSWGIVGALCLIESFVLCYLVEYVYAAFIKKQVPFSPSHPQSRTAIVQQIKTFYPDAVSVVDIGAGYGGLARYVAKKLNTDVLALENMPWCAFVSRILGVFAGGRVKTIYCDAFDFLNKYQDRFDVAIAYLGPIDSKKLLKYKKKLKVLISITFEISELKPVRVIDLNCGGVLFNGVKYPHKLFVYELDK